MIKKYKINKEILKRKNENFQTQNDLKCSNFKIYK